MDDQFFKMSSLAVLIVFVVTIVYCWMLYQIMENVPSEKQSFPRWFIWLFLIPWVGFIFQLIMLPFGIPNAFKNTFPANQDAIRAADVLFKLGLAQVILTVFGFFIPIHPLNQIAGAAGLILWIVYWVKIVQFKNTYLKKIA